MSKQPRLRQRNGAWTYRVRVPDDLRNAIGKREIWCSFGRVSHAEASRLARLKGVEVDALFAEARNSLNRTTPVVESGRVPTGYEDIKRAVQRFFYGLEREAQPVPLDNWEREQAIEAAIVEAGGIHGTPAEDGTVQQVAKQVALDAGLRIPAGSPLFADLVTAVKAAMDEHLSREYERLSLQPIPARHPMFAGIGPDHPPPKAGLSLGEAIDAFQNAPEKAGRSAKTKAAYKFRLAAWTGLLTPGKPLAEVTRADVKAGRDILAKVPPNAAKRWPDKWLAEIAEIAERKGIPPMNPKSVQLYVDALVSLLRWAVAEGEVGQNVATGIGAAAVSGHQERGRRPLTVTELDKLFQSGWYADPASPRDWRWWLPLIGLFQGMRLGEITGLRAMDVAQRDGVWCFVIESHAKRTLKTAQSARVVPVHPMLNELGFLAWAAKQPAGGMLFRNLPGSAEDSNAAQKILSRFFRAAFPDDKACVFHSLRHTWTDAARNAYIPATLMERMGGWKAGGSAMHGYGEGFRPSVLATEIAKVVYLGLDLEHLKRKPAERPAATAAKPRDRKAEIEAWAKARKAEREAAESKLLAQ